MVSFESYGNVVQRAGVKIDFGGGGDELLYFLCLMKCLYFSQKKERIGGLRF